MTSVREGVLVGSKSRVRWYMLHKYDRRCCFEPV